MCPRCHQTAPLVYRGVNAYCTACGAARVPLASDSVTLAGQPARVGGLIARVFGWLALAVGVGIAAVFVGLLLLLGSATSVALGIGGAIVAAAALVAWALLHGANKLTDSGDAAAQTTKQQAIFALASARGGVLRVSDVAQMLNVSLEESDAVLTKLAKEQSDQVAVDIDDDGNVLFRFPAVARARPQMAPNAPPPVRVAVLPARPVEEELASEDAAAEGHATITR